MTDTDGPAPEEAGGSSVWLITGCSTGIGREIALAALARGYRVAVTARDPARVEEIAARHPGRGMALQLDVTRSDQVERSVRETEDAFGRIDVLVNNAGYGYLAAVEEGEEAEVRELFETNYFGVVAMIKGRSAGHAPEGRGAHHQHLVHDRRGVQSRRGLLQLVEVRPRIPERGTLQGARALRDPRHLDQAGARSAPTGPAAR